MKHLHSLGAGKGGDGNGAIGTGEKGGEGDAAMRGGKYEEPVGNVVLFLGPDPFCLDGGLETEGEGDWGWVAIEGERERENTLGGRGMSICVEYLKLL